MLIYVIFSSEYALSDVYNPSVNRNGKFRMGRIGSWSKMTGLRMNEKTTKFQRRQNLDGLTFFSGITVACLEPTY